MAHVASEDLFVFGACVCDASRYRMETHTAYVAQHTAACRVDACVRLQLPSVGESFRASGATEWFHVLVAGHMHSKGLLVLVLFWTNVALEDGSVGVRDVCQHMRANCGPFSTYTGTIWTFVFVIAKFLDFDRRDVFEFQGSGTE